MNILLVNDDGVLAPGLNALVQALAPLGRVVVMAPESERSGFSSALTLDRPLKPFKIAPDVWAVNGTPADCVYLAMHGWLNMTFDLVISGINSGANLSDDVVYSGTVGAVVEACALKYPPLAISLAGAKVRGYQDPQDYQVAAQWVHDFIAEGLPTLAAGYLLNINIPDQPQLSEFKISYPAQRQLMQPLKHATDARGREVVWLSLAAQQHCADPALAEAYSADYMALAHGQVSISPIALRKTERKILADLQQQLARSRLGLL